MTTPFDHRGEIYRAKLTANIERLNSVKLTGYVVGAATGEGVLMTADEKLMVWDLAAQAAKPGKLLGAGSSAESVRETVSLTNKASEAGYHFAVVQAPRSYRHVLGTEEAQVLYFRAVADQTKIPVVVENSPETAGFDISAEAVARLSEHPNIAGLAEGAADMAKVGRMLREVKRGFQILNGNAELLFPALQAGCSGGILAFANAAPYSTQLIWEAFRTREEEAGLDWQNRIGPAAHLVTTKYGIPGLKWAMELNSYYGGTPRLPLLPISLEVKQEIAAAFAEIRS